MHSGSVGPPGNRKAYAKYAIITADIGSSYKLNANKWVLSQIVACRIMNSLKILYLYQKEKNRNN